MVDVVELVIVVGVLEHRDKKVEMQIVLSAPRFKHDATKFVFNVTQSPRTLPCQLITFSIMEIVPPMSRTCYY